MNDFHRQFQINKWYNVYYDGNIEFIDNPVHFFLQNNKGKNLSCKTIAKRTGLKYRNILYYANNHSDIVKVNPMYVGSNKYSVNVFKFTD